MTPNNPNKNNENTIIDNKAMAPKPATPNADKTIIDNKAAAPRPAVPGADKTIIDNKAGGPRPAVPGAAPAGMKPINLNAKQRENVNKSKTMKNVAIGAGAVAGIAAGAVATALAMNAGENTDEVEIPEFKIDPIVTPEPAKPTIQVQEINHVEHVHHQVHHVHHVTPVTGDDDNLVVKGEGHIPLHIDEVGVTEEGAIVAAVHAGPLPAFIVDEDGDLIADAIIFVDENGEIIDALDISDRDISMIALANNEGGTIDSVQLGLFTQEENDILAQGFRDVGIDITDTAQLSTEYETDIFGEGDDMNGEGENGEGEGNSEEGEDIAYIDIDEPTDEPTGDREMPIEIDDEIDVVAHEPAGEDVDVVTVEPADEIIYEDPVVEIDDMASVDIEPVAEPMPEPDYSFDTPDTDMGSVDSGSDYDPSMDL